MPVDGQGRLRDLAVGALAVGLIALLAVVAPGDGRAKGSGPPRVIASDTAQNPDPTPFWGRIDCQSASRHQHIPSGGDPHPTITGQAQGDSAFRRLTVMDGDDFFGERCELGHNFRRGETTFYKEGKRRITAISLRLTPSLPVNNTSFQILAQMKQTNPAANAGGTSMLSLHAFLGQWKLIASKSRRTGTGARDLWAAPAQPGVWTRFLFDVRYSKRKKRGFVRVTADLNGDLDSTDAGETSGRVRTFTLKTEIRGGEPDGLKPGRSIPSHLRTGIYHDPGISCPPPTGCQLDVDNVQVLAP